MDTGWIQVGTVVAEYDRGSGPHGDATLTTVKRVTPTQIMCATGHVFRRDTGFAFGSGRGLLLPPSDGLVVDAVARAQLGDLPAKIAQLCADPGPHAEDVIAALDRIDEAVRSARAAIEALLADRNRRR